MKLFFKRIFLSFILPTVIGLTSVVFWDPFKVFFNYNDYYTNNPITGNREDICVKLLNKAPNNFSNFIIGSSRSQAYKTAYWSNLINQAQNTTFHYDGSAFGLYRTTNSIKYLAKKYKIKNVLLIVDADLFGETTNNPGHLFIQPPMVSKESKYAYYITFLKASLDVKFIGYNLIYKLTGNYYDFMGHHLRKSKKSHTFNNSTGDVWYAYDQDIKSDSVSYYANLISKGVFYERKKIEQSKPLIGEAQVKLLNEIKHVVSKNNINIKVVISPLYDQITFNDGDKQFLKKIFGNTNVYDFSGKNNFTENISNYYENSHYKPYIANRIMDSVYNKSSKSNQNHQSAN
jgi:hypothetical protein